METINCVINAATLKDGQNDEPLPREFLID
jgi:hypothetical protein